VQKKSYRPLVVSSVKWQYDGSDVIGKNLPVPASIAADEFFGLLNQSAQQSVYKHSGLRIKLKLSSIYSHFD